MPAMNETNATWLSIDDAARALGISSRTIRRRLNSGELAGERRGREWLVRMPDVAPSEVDTLRDTVQRLTDNVTSLSKRLSDVEAERDRARELLEAVTGERDYLRQAHAAALSLSQRLLPERTESRSALSVLAFWRRRDA